jgi:hypothetical protein
MRTIIATAIVMIAASLAGCGSDATPAGNGGTADCQGGVRMDAITYTEVGYVAAAGDRVGTAQLGECDDNGKDAAGLTFPKDAETVPVFSVGDVDPGQAVGRKTDDGVQVLLADAIEGSERQQLLADLGIED